MSRLQVNRMNLSAMRGMQKKARDRHGKAGFKTVLRPRRHEDEFLQKQEVKDADARVHQQGYQEDVNNDLHSSAN